MTRLGDQKEAILKKRQSREKKVHRVALKILGFLEIIIVVGY